MNREKIILIDGSGYIFRAYYAIQNLSTSKGVPTNALYGFINMLLKVLDVEKPTKLMIAFDTSRSTFRTEMYKEYKANRTSPPDDLITQMPLIHRAVDCFRIHRIGLDGFEADDVIATVARRAEKEGYAVEIITGDKDLMQLVNDSITLYDTMKDKRINIDGVVEKFGVKPDQIVDFLALMGDSSDNIPGVTGIGAKTAEELIKQFGSIDGIYENIEQIKQAKRKDTLLREKDVAYLSKRLAQINYEAPVNFTWDDLNYRGPDEEKLPKFFEEFEFANLMKRFEFKSTKEFKKGKYESISDEKRLQEVADKLSKLPWLSVDTETTSLNIHDAQMVGISLCGIEGEGYYVPVGHHVLGDPNQLVDGQLSADVVRKVLKPLLENEKVKKVGQNLKYDLQIFRAWGVQLKRIASDTLLASYLLDPEQPHNLDSLAFRHLGHQNITYEEVAGTGRLQINFAEVEVEKATQYSGEDSDIALRLHNKLVPELEKEGLLPLYHDIELPLVEVLGDMEYTGVLVDVAKLNEMSTSLQVDIGRHENRIFEMAGEAFNVNSPKQLSRILFEKLGLPVIRKTKTGNSTDESVLEELSKSHPLCAEIVKYREFQKLRSTYVEGLLAQVSKKTGRVHTNYNQTVAATGRLSSSNPNLQNIPDASDERYDLRSVFIPEHGKEFFSADYSQVELRLLADMSGDPELTRAFKQDEDVHEYTGRLIFGTNTVTPEMRKVAKTINFGVVYGQTPYGLSQTLKISPKEAKQFIDVYFARYAGVRGYMQKVIEDARGTGYVQTKLGRRRYVRDLTATNRMRREMAERAAINAPLQGTAADMIKIAMVSLSRRMEKEKMKSRMLLQVHDELVFEVVPEEKSQIEAMVKKEMESALTLSVPLKVDTGFGKNWREC